MTGASAPSGSSSALPAGAPAVSASSAAASAWLTASGPPTRGNHGHNLVAHGRSWASHGWTELEWEQWKGEERKRQRARLHQAGLQAPSWPARLPGVDTHPDDIVAATVVRLFGPGFVIFAVRCGAAQAYVPRSCRQVLLSRLQRIACLCLSLSLTLVLHRRCHCNGKERCPECAAKGFVAGQRGAVNKRCERGWCGKCCMLAGGCRIHG